MSNLLQKRKNLAGVSLIELILYVGIIVFILSALFFYGWNVIGANIKSQMVRETLSASEFIEARLSSEIRRTKSVNLNNSVFQSAAGKLVLQEDEGDVIFENIDGKLFVKRGQSDGVLLNSGNIRVKSLIFSHQDTDAGEARYVGYSLELESVLSGTSAKSEYQYSLSNNSGSSLRKY